MNRFAFALALAACVLSPIYGDAQVFDLSGSATPPPVTVMPGTPPNVTLINRIPGQEYKILIVAQTRTIPPIAVPAGFPTGEMFIAGFSQCDARPLSDWLAALRNADDEKAVAAILSATKVGELRAKYSETCWNLLAQEKVAEAIEGTRRETDLAGYTLKESDQLIVTVTRVAGSSVKTWTFTLQTAESGHWLTTWGFGFANDRDDRYFQRPLADGTFRITEEREPEKTDLKFIPAVFFHWMPRKHETRDWSFSPLTAGIGVSREAPSVMLGVSLTRRQNVSLIVGGAMSRARRLDGIYEPDQVLKEKVADDKLFENTYRPGVFFSLAIRFARTPFSGGEEKREAGAAGDDAGQTDADKQKKATDAAAAKKRPGE